MNNGSNYKFEVSLSKVFYKNKEETKAAIKDKREERETG